MAILEFAVLVFIILVILAIPACILGASVFALAVTCDGDDDQQVDQQPSASPPDWWNGFTPFSNLEQAEEREKEELGDLRNRGITA